jgi:hypothetical protein
MANPSIGNTTRGYKTYYYQGSSYPSTLTFDGNLNIQDGTRLIVFVKNADVVIKGTIRSQNRGRSSFLLIAEKNIIIDPAVGGSYAADTPSLKEYFTPTVIFLRTRCTRFKRQKPALRGAVVAGSFTLQRIWLAERKLMRYIPENTLPTGRSRYWLSLHF